MVQAVGGRGEQDKVGGRKCPPSPKPGNKHGNKEQRPPPPPESVLFVPHTPGGELKRQVQEAENIANGIGKVGR